eukprot:737361-Pelagomonas_calceolata.AAC.3
MCERAPYPTAPHNGCKGCSGEGREIPHRIAQHSATAAEGAQFCEREVHASVMGERSWWDPAVQERKTPALSPLAAILVL